MGREIPLSHGGPGKDDPVLVTELKVEETTEIPEPLRHILVE